MNENKLFIDNLFVILKDLFSGNDILYVSTPINTGERFIQWYSTIDKKLLFNEKLYNEARKKYVIEPNVKNAKFCINKIRKSTGKVIIDPTTFESEILEWTQDEFYHFWDKIIKELVSEIILLDGWEYSVGCCHELLSAIESNINIYSEDMKRLSINECIIRLKKSINLYTAHDIKDFKRIEIIFKKIEKYNKSNFHNILKHNEKETFKDEKLDILIKNDISKRAATRVL